MTGAVSGGRHPEPGGELLRVTALLPAAAHARLRAQPQHGGAVHPTALKVGRLRVAMSILMYELVCRPRPIVVSCSWPVPAQVSITYTFDPPRYDVVPGLSSWPPRRSAPPYDVRGDQPAPLRRCLPGPALTEARP